MADSPLLVSVREHMRARAGSTPTTAAKKPVNPGGPVQGKQPSPPVAFPGGPNPAGPPGGPVAQPGPIRANPEPTPGGPVLPPELLQGAQRFMASLSPQWQAAITGGIHAIGQVLPGVLPFHDHSHDPMTGDAVPTMGAGGAAAPMVAPMDRPVQPGPPEGPGFGGGQKEHPGIPGQPYNPGVPGQPSAPFRPVDMGAPGRTALQGPTAAPNPGAISMPRPVGPFRPPTLGPTPGSMGGTPASINRAARS